MHKNMVDIEALKSDIEKMESAKRAVVQLGKELCAMSDTSFFSSSEVSEVS